MVAIRADILPVRKLQVAESIRGGDGKLRRIIKAWIPEPPLPVHPQRRDKRVPVWNASPTCPRVQVDATQTKCRFVLLRVGTSLIAVCLLPVIPKPGDALKVVPLARVHATVAAM